MVEVGHGFSINVSVRIKIKQNRAGFYFCHTPAEKVAVLKDGLLFVSHFFGQRKTLWH